MELIFTLLKQLSASLSPTEFLMVLGIIVGATTFLVRLILKNKSKIVSWLTGQKEIDETQKALDDIQTKLSTMLSTNVFQQELSRLDASVKLALATQAADIDVIRSKLSDLASIRQELITTCGRILDEVSDIKHILQTHNDGSQHQYREMLLQLTKSQESISRNLLQIEKLDEFFKAAIPEFRGYHRDLGTELNNLSRDIALVERSLQLQINSNNAVKLR